VWSPDGSRIVTLRGPRRWQLAKVDRICRGVTSCWDLAWVSSQGGATNLIARAHGASVPHFVRDQPDRNLSIYSELGLDLHASGWYRSAYSSANQAQGLLQDRKLDYTFASEDGRMSPDGRWVSYAPAASFISFPRRVSATNH